MKPYIRCKRCGSPTKREGAVGRPRKYCMICAGVIAKETMNEINKKRQHDKWNYVHKVNLQLRFSEDKQIDYCNTPHGLYKVLGSRETETYS